MLRQSGVDQRETLPETEVARPGPGAVDHRKPERRPFLEGRTLLDLAELAGNWPDSSGPKAAGIASSSVVSRIHVG